MINVEAGMFHSSRFLFGLDQNLTDFSAPLWLAPLQARQIGGIACNIARLQIVTDLAQTKNLLSKVDT